MRNKKGIDKIIAEIILGLIVVFVFIWLLTGGFQNLFGIVTGQVHVPGGQNQTSDQSLDFSLMKEPLKMLTDAMEKARNSATAKGCIVDLAMLPSDFNDYQILIEKYSGGTDIYLAKNGKQRRFSTVDNIFPCAVYGNDALSGEPIAKNFYDNWLGGTRCPGCKKDFNEFTEIIIPKPGQIILDGTKKDRKILSLYKADASHACFFVTYGGSIFGKCSGGQDGLDDDCATAVKASLPECPAPIATTTTLVNTCAEYSKSHGGGFACQDIANCGFTKDASGLSQCDANPAKCARQKCSGDIYNVCCKG